MYALKNLINRPTRTTLSVLGVAISIALTITMFSISEGIRASYITVLEDTGVDIYILPKGGNLFFGSTYIENGTMMAKSMIREEGVVAASPILKYELYATKSIDETSYISEVTVFGEIPNMRGNFKDITIVEGEYLPTFSDLFRRDLHYINSDYTHGTESENFTHEIIINTLLAEVIQAKVNDTIYLSVSGAMSYPTMFKICGISKPSFDYPNTRTATMHLSELQYITQLPNDTISQILIDLKNPKDSGKMKLLFEEKYNVSAFVPDDYLKIVSKFTNVFEGFANMVIVITTAVALMFISTIMVISVREMQGEIGVLRAMGLSKLTVFKSILAESLLICMSGYFLGVLFGFVGARVLNWYIKTTEEYIPVDFQVTVITPNVIIYAALFALVMGCISGMIPAIWTTRLNITQVLKEG